MAWRDIAKNLGQSDKLWYMYIGSHSLTLYPSPPPPPPLPPLTHTTHTHTPQTYNSDPNILQAIR